jgi:hypothetical protein
MNTSSDSLNTVDLGRYYAILPSAADHFPEDYLSKRGGERVAPGFAYDSGTNPSFLTVEELRGLISQHVHPVQAVRRA